MKHVWLTPILLASGLALLGASGSACSCIPPGSPSEELARSDVVLAAEVLSIRSVDGTYDLEVRLEVIRSFKGLGAEVTRIAVRTARDGAACGYGFEEGRAYLVYGDEDSGRVRVTLCSRTRPLAEAGEDLEVFGAEELEQYVPSPDGEGCGGSTNLGMIQAASFTLIGIGVLRRRRRLA